MIDYFLFADEANPEQTDPNKFFIYGGVIFPTSAIGLIHDEVEALRLDLGLSVQDQLKFNSRSKPKSLTTEQHTAAKQVIYEIAARHGVKFIGYAVLHAIARKKDHSTLVEFGANILLAKFNQFLGENKATGWANFDRLNTEKPYAYLQAKFENRQSTEDSHIRLERVLGYSFTCDGASHHSSVADIIIGGFRYVMNEPERDVAGRAIVQAIGPIFWGKQNSEGVTFIGERGLVLRPKNLSAPSYQADYAEVKARLTDWSRTMNENEQP
ncbi:hypothetical protein [Tabrizicola sp. M-4]|uniref:hypothetical protein n=1 Tax=Tabrizicola sp. M-4 TaxID=3055847 RepID=UPI003DA80119